MQLALLEHRHSLSITQPDVECAPLVGFRIHFLPRLVALRPPSGPAPACAHEDSQQILSPRQPVVQRVLTQPAQPMSPRQPVVQRTRTQPQQQQHHQEAAQPMHAADHRHCMFEGQLLAWNAHRRAHNATGALIKWPVANSCAMQESVCPPMEGTRSSIVAQLTASLCVSNPLVRISGTSRGSCRGLSTQRIVRAIAILLPLFSAAGLKKRAGRALILRREIVASSAESCSLVCCMCDGRAIVVVRSGGAATHHNLPTSWK